MSTKPTIIEIAMDDLEDILRRAEAKQFNDQDYDTAKTVLTSYVELLAMLKRKDASIGRLQKLLFGASTEKTAAVTSDASDSQPGSSDQAGPLDDEPAATDSGEEPDGEADSPSSGKGHGRNGADAYEGAEQVEVPHDALQPGWTTISVNAR